MINRLAALLLFIAGSATTTMLAGQAFAQKQDSIHVDSAHSVTFTPTSSNQELAPQRTIDMVLSGGAGYYIQGLMSAIQPTASADFFAQTSDLDFTAGFHWGFSDPSTKSLSLGLRFPLYE